MNKPEIPDWLRGSEMGEIIHSHDWTESGLGPIQTWPCNLQIAINIVLSLPSPATLFLGPKLVQVYNDSFRHWVGAEHPACLGQPVSEFWPEVWDFLAPVCEGVMQRRESFIFEDQALTVKRSGILKEGFFRLTYSPIPGDVSNHGDGIGTSTPGGVLVTVNETTELVRARARSGAYPSAWSAASTTDSVVRGSIP